MPFKLHNLSGLDQDAKSVCRTTVSSGGNKPLCVFFHTCVGKPQHLFVWFFHTYVVISTRVCKNTHLCGKNHTDGNCVVCGYYHTHVVKTKHAWKSLSLKFKGGFLPRGPSPFLALMIWNPIVILNDFTLPQIHQVLF